MSEPKTCIVNVTFKERYLPFQTRLRESLKKFAPDTPTCLWTDTLPPGSPIHGAPTHYAFKLFAIDHAKKAGYERILWLDAGTEVLAPIEPIFAEISRRKVLIVSDEMTLDRACGDHCLEYFRMTRKEASLYKLTGGGVIGIDLTTDKGRYFYEEWWWAFLAGCYKDGNNGHRWDESIFGCLTAKLHLDLLRPGPLWDFRNIGPTILATGYERGPNDNR